MSSRRVVILGYGMAGARLADEIRRRDPAGDRVALTVVGEEPRSAYNRVLLSAVVAGTMRPEAVALHDDDWATRTRVDLRTGSCATKIDRAARRVELADGSSVNYDALVLATGATPWLPPTEGLTTEDGEPAPGVVAFRTLDDCERILEAARIGAPVVVIGGGLLGLEAARHQGRHHRRDHRRRLRFRREDQGLHSSWNFVWLLRSDAGQAADGVWCRAVESTLRAFHALACRIVRDHPRDPYQHVQ
jgi:NAD(P)H-nitrite reductase large subunit